MSCTSPIKAYRSWTGEITFTQLARHGECAPLKLACGGCVGCRLSRANNWAARVMHEAAMHESNCFVTLTYDDAHLPSNMSLNHRDFQLFLKRLRKLTPIRYYMCGEYGSMTFRPHYHVCLFNVNFKHDQRLQQVTDTNSYIYSSPTLTKLWPLGQSTVGDLNWQSAAYTARYVMQKITGQAAAKHYGNRLPEYNRMSLKPGIGAAWYDRFYRDVDTFDYLVVDGVKTPVPKYYDTLHKRRDQAEMEQTSLDRVAKAWPRWADQTPERLAVKNQVSLARISTLKRNLE